MEMIRTSGNRRRVLIAIFIGLFTQMSGNTLLSYYSSLLFDMMGFNSPFAKTRINLANNCWSFINGTIIALIVTRFKRRHMFMLSSLCMCLVFIAMTISFERLRDAKNNGATNPSASISALFFYFAYSPTYNIGNNALTYSEKTRSQILRQVRHMLILLSLPHRNLPLRDTKSWNWNTTNIRKDGGFLLQQRKPACTDCTGLEIPSHLLWLDCFRIYFPVPVLPGDAR
jgi:hypothetical protein